MLEGKVALNITVWRCALGGSAASSWSMAGLRVCKDVLADSFWSFLVGRNQIKPYHNAVLSPTGHMWHTKEEKTAPEAHAKQPA